MSSTKSIKQQELIAEILVEALSDKVDDSLSEALARHFSKRGLVIEPRCAESRCEVTTYYSHNQPKSWR